MAAADILVYVGHVARELDASCAIRHHLRTSHGLEMAIASVNFDPYDTIVRHAPKVVAFPWFNEDNDVAIRKVRKYWPDAVYLNLAYEQVFQQINQKVKAPHGSFARDQVRHHAWGEFYKTYLVGHGVPEQHVTVNGNPAFGLYRQPYRRFFPSKTELAGRFGLNPSLPWLLVPENYGAAFYPDAYIDQMVKWGAAREEAEAYREFARRSLAEMCRWLASAAGPNREIILRPRPYTRLAAFEASVRQAIGEPPAGLHVIQEGTVREWILAADQVMTSYSTSLIEAAVADKPVAMIVPEPLPEFVRNPWYDLVPQLGTRDDFVQMVEERSATQEPLRAWAESTMLPYGDPLRNMADWMAGLCRESKANGRMGVADKLDAQVHRALRGLKRALKGNIDKAVEHDRFDQSEVEARTQRWAQILNGMP